MDLTLEIEHDANMYAAPTMVRRTARMALIFSCMMPLTDRRVCWPHLAFSITSHNCITFDNTVTHGLVFSNTILVRRSIFLSQSTLESIETLL